MASEANRNAVLSRWNKIPGYIEVEIDNLTTGLAQHYTAPKQIVRLVWEQLDYMLKQPVDASYFYTPATRDSTPAFTEALSNIIKEKIYLKIKSYWDFLRDTYLPKAREEISIAAIPNGAACYKALLRSSTTLNLPPAQVYEEGIKAVQERENKIRTIGTTVYHTSNLAAIRDSI